MLAGIGPMTPASSAPCLSPMPNLRDIHRRLTALTEQAVERGRDASAVRADDEKVVAIQRALLESEQTWHS